MTGLTLKQGSWLALALASILMAGAASAQAPDPVPTVMPAAVVEAPPAAAPITLAPVTAAAVQQPFDPAAATEAYLASVPAEARARSDAYFEGGYWLKVFQFLIGTAILLLILGLGWSAGMRDRAERITRRKPLQTVLYWWQLSVVSAVLAFPMTAYSNWWREHSYGLSTQDFGAWLGDQAKGLGVQMVMGSLLMIPLYGVLRRATRTWWLWGSGVFVAFIVFSMTIGPVYIAPLFNEYTRVEDLSVRGSILRLAHANGLEDAEIWQVDESRQSTRISANVSGLFHTQRIVLNDNLLKRCSLPEIETVMGHEIGHYALHHVALQIAFLSAMIVAAFAFVRFAFERLIHGRGRSWNVRGIGDVAGLPLVDLLLSVFLFLAFPLTNTMTRTFEAEADLFGLNAARQPDGFAQVALKLGDYRKLDPGPVEEWIFFDHPSGRSRIQMAMRWKAAQLEALPEGAKAGQPAPAPTP